MLKQFSLISNLSRHKLQGQKRGHFWSVRRQLQIIRASHHTGQVIISPFAAMLCYNHPKISRQQSEYKTMYKTTNKQVKHQRGGKKANRHHQQQKSYFANYCQFWIERCQTTRRKTRCPSHKLQERSLLFSIKLSNYFQ